MFIYHEEFGVSRTKNKGIYIILLRLGEDDVEIKKKTQKEKRKIQVPLGGI